jgi:hypothetical protein
MIRRSASPIVILESCPRAHRTGSSRRDRRGSRLPAAPSLRLAGRWLKHLHDPVALDDGARATERHGRQPRAWPRRQRVCDRNTTRDSRTPCPTVGPAHASSSTLPGIDGPRRLRRVGLQSELRGHVIAAVEHDRSNPAGLPWARRGARPSRKAPSYPPPNASFNDGEALPLAGACRDDCGVEREFERHSGSARARLLPCKGRRARF